MKATNVRILISCLALAAMVVMAAPAYAGGVAFQASSLPVQVRGEGLTETVGAVVLQATGPGSITSGSSITLVFSGAITNASSFTAGGNAGLSCSGAGITAVAPSCVATITSSASGSQLTVSFGGAAGTTYTFAQGDSIEVNQVRMNVNALGSATTTATATLSGTSSAPTTNPITFTQSQVVVASIVNPSIKASSFTAATAIQTCATASSTFSLKVTENYPAALTSTADESGFTPITVAANGSLVTVTISNLPAGYGVQFVSAAPQGTSAIALTPTAASAGGTGTPVNISTGSPIVYVFAVTGDSTSIIDSSLLTFNVGYGNSAGTTLGGTSAPALGTVVSATATVSLGPGSGIVSFATNNEGSGTIVTIGDCVTNLLFPFTTNQVGFDSNIQISNTSADKLAFPTGGATAQSGTCTLTYYPTDLTTQTSSAAGTAGTPTQFTTPTIPAGGTWSAAQSTTTFKGQSGYMFAVCRFLDAHGFSFVVNGTPTTGTISQGLLALVIPNTSIAGGRLANPACATASTCVGISGGTYEGLVH